MRKSKENNENGVGLIEGLEQPEATRVIQIQEQSSFSVRLFPIRKMRLNADQKVPNACGHAT